MFQQRQALRPKLANFKTFHEDGEWGWLPTAPTCLQSLWGGIHHLWSGSEAIPYCSSRENGECRSTICIKMNNRAFWQLVTSSTLTCLGYNKHPCTLPVFLPPSEPNIEVYKTLHFPMAFFFNETKIKHKSSHFNGVFLPAADYSWCKPNYIFIPPDRISLELAGMCRQETTVRFWGWKAVKDKNQATELRPVSAGHYHLLLRSLLSGKVGVGWGGHVGRCKMQTAPSDARSARSTSQC